MLQFFEPLFCNNGPNFCILSIPPFQTVSDFPLNLVKNYLICYIPRECIRNLDLLVQLQSVLWVFQNQRVQKVMSQRSAVSCTRCTRSNAFPAIEFLLWGSKSQSRKNRGCLSLIFNMKNQFWAIWAALKKLPKNIQLWIMSNLELGFFKFSWANFISFYFSFF